MVFNLDYDRRSDIDDSVGYWFAQPTGPTSCRVFYSCECKLRGWVPGPVYALMTMQERRDFVESCPKKLPKPDTHDYECVESEEASACMVCLDCLELSQTYPGLCKVKDRPQYFKFSVESNGALKPEEIVQRGIQLLKIKLREVRTKLEEAQKEINM